MSMWPPTPTLVVHLDANGVEVSVSPPVFAVLGRKWRLQFRAESGRRGDMTKQGTLAIGHREVASGGSLVKITVIIYKYKYLILYEKCNEISRLVFCTPAI